MRLKMEGVTLSYEDQNEALVVLNYLRGATRVLCLTQESSQVKNLDYALDEAFLRLQQIIMGEKNEKQTEI